MALTIYFIFHMIVEGNGVHNLRQIAISRKFIKGDQLRNQRRISDFLVFWQTESSIKLLLIVENSKANYLKVFWNFHTC